MRVPIIDGTFCLKKIVIDEVESKPSLEGKSPEQKDALDSSNKLF